MSTYNAVGWSTIIRRLSTDKILALQARLAGMTDQEHELTHPNISRSVRLDACTMVLVERGYTQRDMQLNVVKSLIKNRVVAN